MCVAAHSVLPASGNIGNPTEAHAIASHFQLLTFPRLCKIESSTDATPAVTGGGDVLNRPNAIAHGGRHLYGHAREHQMDQMWP
jgi:hypothetical protein